MLVAQDGYVVAGAVGERLICQANRKFLQGKLAQLAGSNHVGDLAFIQHIRHPIAGHHNDVARPKSDHPCRGHETRRLTQIAIDRVGQRMPLGLLPGDQATINEPLNLAVIVRELAESASAIQIAA